MDFVESCRHLISVDTSPGQGTQKAVDWLVQVARERGLNVETYPETVGDLEQSNLVIRPKGSARSEAEVLFQSHLDTTDPGPFAHWKSNFSNPFDAQIIDGKIFGLGAADCKLDFLCKLEAMTHFKPNPKSSLKPVLVGTFGEEQGMLGALRLIRKNRVSAKVCFVGEASDLKLLTAGKGYAKVEIHIPFGEDEQKFRLDHNLRESTSTMSKSFHGKAAHSSAPQLGDSAIKKMLEHLKSLPEDLAIMDIEGGVSFNSVASSAFIEIDPQSGFEAPMAAKLQALIQDIEVLEKKFASFIDRDFTPPHPTLNMGRICTTEAGIDIQGTVRIPPSVSNEIYEAWMQEFKLACEKIKAQFRFSDYKRPYRTPDESPWIRGSLDIMKQLNMNVNLSTHATTNEASLFSRVGMDCISFGPGTREGNVYTANEHVPLQDLKAAILFYSRVMERFCA